MPGPDRQGDPGDDRHRRGLTHVDAGGRARMVDVSGKPWTRRRALARSRVVPGSSLRAAIAGAAHDSSDVDRRAHGASRLTEILEAARLAGVQAAKQTSKLVPLCHSLVACDVQVALAPVGGCVEVESRAEVVGPTGVEMEALTACTVAALAVVASLLPLDPAVRVEDVALWERSGGRSGTWTRT